MLAKISSLRLVCFPVLVALAAVGGDEGEGCAGGAAAATPYSGMVGEKAGDDEEEDEEDEEEDADDDDAGDGDAACSCGQ